MRTVVAAVVCGLTVFVGLIAQDGPETVVRGTKQFRQSEVVTGTRRAVRSDVGPGQYAVGDGAHGQAHHSRESGDGRAEGGGDDR